ncbi:MAG TPA: acetylglutamate kinase [Vicinamibacterales bacterium]|nr:acetylglutamate kinase [Vicinamibacterales bacterium]
MKNPRRRAVVLKVGGELLESATAMTAMARMIARAARTVTLVIVHGGGREIDAALTQATIPKHQVDGLRITDERTLAVVVAVLAGSINTRLVAAINTAGGRAVGLTGADAGVGLVRAAKPHRATNGELVDLGLVGDPIPGVGAPLIDILCREGFVPVVACIGASKDGRLFNVNADTLAASLAARLEASRLVFAGGTAGVLDAAGETIAHLTTDAIDGLIASGTATTGMVAKLRAARHALGAGVGEIAIADGRTPKLTALTRGTAARRGPWTRLT